MSARNSIRMEGRDYSLIAVAVMFMIFGLGVSNSVIPNYHEQQALEHRRAGLQQQVEKQKAHNHRIEDEIQALDDPYYMAQTLIEKLGYTHAVVDHE
jgi:cell division protein FtsB